MNEGPDRLRSYADGLLRITVSRQFKAHVQLILSNLGKVRMYYLKSVYKKYLINGSKNACLHKSAKNMTFFYWVINHLLLIA